MVFSALRRLRYIYGIPPLDNFIFQLFYRWTVLLLVIFSFIVTCRLVLGDSFECVNNAYAKPWTVYCYDVGVFTYPARLVTKEDEVRSLLPPVKDFRKYQMHYGWVNLLFLVQAFIFYLPHLLWMTYERGYIHRMAAGVQKFFDVEETRDFELSHLAKYILVTQGKHERYMEFYIFLEVCNFVISIALDLWLVFFFDVFHVPNFLPNVIESWSDFKLFYFPSTGLCEWMAYGSSGDMQRHQALCHLPLNSLYMKLFLFLHAWYILLAILGSLVLTCRILLLVPSFRVFATKLSSPLCDKSVLTSLCSTLSYGDWFFLSRLQKAMTDIDFPQVVDKVSLASREKDDSEDLNGRSLSEEETQKHFDSVNRASIRLQIMNE